MIGAKSSIRSRGTGDVVDSGRLAGLWELVTEVTQRETSQPDDRAKDRTGAPLGVRGRARASDEESHGVLDMLLFHFWRSVHADRSESGRHHGDHGEELLGGDLDVVCGDLLLAPASGAGPLRAAWKG